MVIQVDSTEVEETWVHFVELVQTLIKDSEQREHFFQVRNTCPTYCKRFMRVLLISESKNIKGLTL